MTPRSAGFDKVVSTKTSSSVKPTKAPSASTTSNTIGSRSTISSLSKKRPRSSSLSESPPPSKRPATAPSDAGLRAEIWKLFGKDRTTYVQNDVISDDEDMEADARALEREEKRRFVTCSGLCVGTTDSDGFTVLVLLRRRRKKPWPQSGGTRKRNAGGRRRRKCASEGVDLTFESIRV